jgi:hypothetical protein
MDALVEVSVKVLGGGRAPQSSSYAIDWSDYESYARPPRKRRGKAQDPDAQPAQNAASAPRPTKAQDAAQQANGPQQDEFDNATEQETEKERCADPEAAWGHRKTNHPGTSETFFGYYLQAVTIVREENSGDVPELVRRVTLASPKHDPPAMIVPVIQRMHEDGNRDRRPARRQRLLIPRPRDLRHASPRPRRKPRDRPAPQRPRNEGHP